MFGWMLLVLGGCAPKLGKLEVSYGYPAPMPLVQPSTDTRRWYVPMDTSALGPVVWFVDTGYTYSTCDDDLVEALGIGSEGHVRVRGELGSLPAQKAVLPTMDLGGHALGEVVCIVRDLGATSSLDDPLEVPIAGVIGMDILRRFRLHVDPAEGRLTLLDPGDGEPLQEGAEGVYRLRRKGLRARMALEVDGRTIWPILDTGASHTYVDGQWLGLVPSQVAEQVTVRGTGATGAAVRRVVSYDLDGVRVGAWPVQPFTVTDRPRRSREPGLLGLDLLSRFEQDYDFQRGLVRLLPTATAEVPQFSEWWRPTTPIPAMLHDEAPAIRAAGLGLGPAAEADATHEASELAPP